MAAKTKTTVSTIDLSPLYHDFEPYCEWKRGEDMLIVHVPEFKKEHLRVQVNTSGALKICGERTLEGDKATTRSRFYKEARVPEGCNINDIHAKLSDGKLTILLPRNPPSIFPLGVQPPSSSDPSTRPCSSVLDKVLGKGHLDEKNDEMIGFGGFKVAKKIVVNVGIAVVAIAAISAHVFFKPETPPSAAPPSSSPSSAALANKEK